MYNNIFKSHASIVTFNTNCEYPKISLKKKCFKIENYISNRKKILK